LDCAEIKIKNLTNENLQLKSEINSYKKEIDRLKNKVNKLITDNNILNDELIKATKIVSEFSLYKNVQQGNNNVINNLNELVKIKDNEINNLKVQLQYNSNNKKYVNYNKILVINFISLDQKINCGISCLETDTFAEVEEKLYQKYEEYRETNNNFLARGRIILRFKTISGNNIKDGDKIQLIAIE